MQIERFSLGAISPLTEWEKNADRTLDRLFQTLIELLNAGLRFEDNNSLYRVTITTSATPNTEQAVAHTLKNRTPIGYLVISSDKAAHIYDGTTAWTTSNIYLRSDVASVTAKLLVF